MRIRQEQRFLDSWGDSSHGLRIMGRAVRPVDAEKLWSVVAWSEILFTLDDTVNGPAQGAGASPRKHDHVLFAWLNLTF